MDICSIHEITVIKFNSAERRNSYLEKPCHEQLHYLERIRNEPGMLLREALLALEHHLLGYEPLPILSDAPLNPPPGWEISVYRKMRGLPENVVAPFIDGDAPAADNVDPGGLVVHWEPQRHDEFRTIGFHSPEQWKGQPFCWTSSVSVLEACLDMGDYSVEVHVLPIRKKQELHILINGVEVETKNADNHYVAHFRQEIASMVQLTLRTNGRRPRSDARILGVPLRRIIWRRI